METAYSFTANPEERCLELSPSLQSLGVYLFTTPTPESTQNPLMKKGQNQHEQDVLKKDTRVHAYEKLQSWKRVKTVVRRKDGLLRFLEQIEKKQESKQDDVDEWLQIFADVQTGRLLDTVETFGVPSLKRLTTRGNAPANLNFLLDSICEKKLPISRATWLFKFSWLLSEKKKNEERMRVSHNKNEDRMRMHTLPHPITKSILDWLQKGLGDTTRRASLDPQEKWCRGSALLRWMFEDGLLRTSILFEELIKLLKLVFGTKERYPEKIQILVAAEICSYTMDAVNMGYTRDFLEVYQGLLKQTNILDPIRDLFKSCLKLCEKKLISIEILQEPPIWIENRVGLAWELENLKLQLTDRRLGQTIWKCLSYYGFLNHFHACLVLLEWAANFEKYDKEERTEIAVIGLTEAYVQYNVDIGLVFTHFQPLTEQVLEICGWIISSLLIRGIPVRSTNKFNKNKKNEISTFQEFLFRKNQNLIDFANELIANNFELESSMIFSKLHQISPPSARVRVMIWLLGKVSNCTLNLALVPFIETSPIFRQLLYSTSDNNNNGEDDNNLMEEDLREEEEIDLGTKFRKSLEAREKKMNSDAESRRIREFRSFSPSSSVTDHNGFTPQPQNKPKQRKAPVRNVLASVFEFANADQGGSNSTTTTTTNSNTILKKSSQSSQETQTSTPSIKSLTETGYLGEMLRYEEGLRLINEPIEKIANSVKEHFLTNKKGANFYFQLRDLVICRLREDRILLTTWCLNSIDTLSKNPPIVELIESRLCQVEEVLNYCAGKKFIPNIEILNEMLKSKVCIEQIRNLGIGTMRFVTLLLNSAKKEMYFDFLKFLSSICIARGETSNFIETEQGLVKNNNNENDIKKLRENIKKFVVDEDDTYCDPWKIASRGWYLNGQKPEEISRFIISQANTNEQLAIAFASVAVIWKIQDVICVQIYDMCEMSLSNLIRLTNLRYLLCRCLNRATVLKTRQLFARLIVKGILNDAIEDNNMETCLSILKSCFVDCPIPCIDADSALQVLRKIQPNIEIRLTVELIIQCFPLHQKEIAALIEVWERKYEYMDFSSIRRALDPEMKKHGGNNVEIGSKVDAYNILGKTASTTISTANTSTSSTDQQMEVIKPINFADAGKAAGENLILCGNGSEKLEDIRFVDAWFVLEGAKESAANFEFLQGAVMRN